MRLIEPRIHIKNQRLARVAGLSPGCHVTCGIAIAQVAHVLPRQVGTLGEQQVRTQFVQCGQGGVSRFAKRVFPGNRSVAVKHLRTRLVAGTAIVRDPGAQQIGHFLIGAIGLALVNVRRGVVIPLWCSIGGETAHIRARNHNTGGGLACAGVDDTVEGVVWGQVDGDLAAIGTLADEIEAVVEELAE